MGVVWEWGFQCCGSREFPLNLWSQKLGRRKKNMGETDILLQVQGGPLAVVNSYNSTYNSYLAHLVSLLSLFHSNIQTIEYHRNILSIYNLYSNHPGLIYPTTNISVFFKLNWHLWASKYLLRRCFGYAFGVQIPPHKVFGSLGHHKNLH